MKRRGGADGGRNAVWCGVDGEEERKEGEGDVVMMRMGGHRKDGEGKTENMRGGVAGVRKRLHRGVVGEKRDGAARGESGGW